MTTMTQAEWAKSQGFSRQYVQKLIKSGRIQLVDGKIDSDSANQALAMTKDYDRPEQRHNMANVHNDEYPEMMMQIKLKKEIEALKRLEIGNRAKSGEWISVEEVKKSAFKRGREVRDALLNIPDRIADQLAVMTDAHQIYTLLHQEIRSAVEVLTQDV